MLNVSMRPAPRWFTPLFLSIAAVAVACLSLPNGVGAEGTLMFPTVPSSTGEKPQSKIWYHDGSYWAIVQGPVGVAFYEKVGSNWVRGTFANAVLAPTGQADVKWNGTDLFVLNYAVASTVQLFKYSYVAATRTWSQRPGFPVSLPNPSGTETMVLDQDSTGRLWATTMTGGTVHVYYSTSADHLTWSSSPIVLHTGASADDISSVIAFGGNRIGVFWSDQPHDQFDFRIHLDSDAPETWGAKEIAFFANGQTDDHINLATDSQGRVYAITKDSTDHMRVHRRATDGTWTTVVNVLNGRGTRGIIQVSEADARVYILYTRWDIVPERIEYRWAHIDTLTFGHETNFISSLNNMNNVTGMKQPLPPGSLVAVAEGGNQCWYNSFGSPPPLPPAPSNLTATLLTGPARTDLSWSAPPDTVLSGYNIYRQASGGSFFKLNASLVTATSYTDSTLPLEPLCYHVRTVRSNVESVPSSTACVDNSPPGTPTGLMASLAEVPGPTAHLLLRFDEGSGQVARDTSGNANHARLGSSTGSDTADPLWVSGQAGGALRFDGSNDYLLINDAPSLDPGGSFTIEAWVHHDTGVGTLVNKGGSGSRTYRVRIDNGGDVEFRWDDSSGNSHEVNAAQAILDTLWHHVACVYDQSAGENRIFVDGVERVAAAASGVPITNDAVLTIGTRLSGNNLRDFIDGAVDGLRIAPSALYAANFVPPAAPPLSSPTHSVTLAWQPPQSGTPAVTYRVHRSTDGGAFTPLTAPIAATSWVDSILPFGTHCYQVTAINADGHEGLGTDPVCVEVFPPLLAAPQPFTAEIVVTPGGPPVGVAAYGFEETSGQTFGDATGNGLAGTRGASSATEFSDPPWTAGIAGSCLRFDGVDDRAFVPDAPQLRLSGSFTLEAWIATGVGAANGCILAKGLEGALNYALRLDAAGNVELRWNDASTATHGVTTSASPAVTDGSWHHVAAVYDNVAAECRVYVDGALAAAAPAIGTPVTSASSLRLGCRQVVGGNSEFFRGSVDLVRIASSALYEAPFTPRPTLDPPSSTKIHLAWSPVADAVEYRLYRQVEGGPWELLHTAASSATTFDDLSPASGSACYRIVALDEFEREGTPSVIACVAPATTDSEDLAGVRQLGLAVHPNPFRGRAQFAFELPATAHLRLDVFDVRGRRVVTLVDASRTAGRHVAVWNGLDSHGRRVPAGVYFTVLESAGRRLHQKLIVLR